MTGPPDVVMVPPAHRPLQHELTPLADGVYAYVQPGGGWLVNNCGVVTGADEVLLVDACATERRTRALLAAIQAVTPAPVRTAVVTHNHADHTAGLSLLPGVCVVGHELTRMEIRAGFRPPEGFPRAREAGAVRPVPPGLTFTRGVDIWVGPLCCEVRHVGRPAHSTNDSTVWIPEHRVLFAGDVVFAGVTPFLLAGSVRGAAEVLTVLRTELDPLFVVPGHGPVGGPELLDQMLGYVQFVESLARWAHSRRISPLIAARGADLGPYANWGEGERLVANLHRAYAELDGAVPGAPLDVAAAVRDMVAINGGRPLRCDA